MSTNEIAITTGAKAPTCAAPPESLQRRFIVVLGPDGSGKTTVVNSLSQLLACKGTPVANFHWRPQFRRTGGPPIVIADPHGKTLRSVFTSVLKLFFLIWKFNFGFRETLQPLLRAGHVVIFDRYYSDMLIDPIRYRYGAPLALARWASQCIPQPDLWIILDAPDDILRARKQEVSAEETTRQRRRYVDLARTLKNSYVLDASRTPEVLARQILQLLD